MIVRDELGDGPSKVALSERHDAMQTFSFDRAYEALGVRIGIRARYGVWTTCNPASVSWFRPRALTGIPIADEHPVEGERPYQRRSARGHLFHETRLGDDACNRGSGTRRVAKSMTNSVWITCLTAPPQT